MPSQPNYIVELANQDSFAGGKLTEDVSWGAAPKDFVFEPGFAPFSNEVAPVPAGPGFTGSGIRGRTVALSSVEGNAAENARPIFVSATGNVSEVIISPASRSVISGLRSSNPAQNTARTVLMRKFSGLESCVAIALTPQFSISSSSHSALEENRSA
jgi:hypothetical protein